MKKRLMAMVLAIMMVVSLLPTSAWADDGDADAPIVEEVIPEEPVVEEVPEEPVVGEVPEEPVVGEVPEEPIVEEIPEEPGEEVIPEGELLVEGSFLGDGEPADDPTGMTEDEYGVYHIADQAALEDFRDRVNTGSSFAGRTVVLDADIAFAGTWSVGIGVPESKFSGVFDGQGHTISNLSVSAAGYAGLFGTVYDATVKNLTLSNPVIVNTATDYSGAAVAHGYARISNVSVVGGSVTGAEQVGGIIGYLSCGSVKNCSVSGVSITATVNRVGGIAGKTNTDSEYVISGNTVTNSAVNGSLAGGVVGQIMALAGHTWQISDNKLVGIALPTDGNYVGNFRADYMPADAADHITGNSWNPGPAKITMTDGTNSFELENHIPAAYIGGTAYYSFTEAVAAAQSGNVIKMNKDAVLEGNAGITIPAGLSVTLDLNGHTLSNLVNESKASQVILNKGSLTITDSSASGTGKIMNAVDPEAVAGEWWSDPRANYATNVITNCGTLTVNGGELYQTAAGSICYAIDNNSSGANAILTVNDGYIHKDSGTAVRQYANSTTYENTVNMNGGTIEAGYAAIWIQLPGSAGQAKKAGLNVTGGTLRGTNEEEAYAFYDYSYGDIFTASQYNLSGGVFDGYVYSFGANVSITGGEFLREVDIMQDAPSSVSVSGGTFWEGLWCFSEIAPENVSENYISGGSFKTSEDFTAEDISVGEGYRIVEDADGWLKVELIPDTARIGEVSYKTLTDALAAAWEMSGDVTIELLDDLAETVVVHQKAGLNLTIDGKGKTLIGEIIIDGNGRHDGADTLTIANINFVANTADDLPLKTTFIDATSTVGYVTGGRYGYAHNVTVANCSFTGDGVSEMVAVRVESGGGGKNITLTGNTGTKLHSLAQLTGVTTATFIDNTISNCGSAVNISGGKGAYLFEGNSFTCTESNGYGIRVKDTTEVEVTIQNGNTFSAVNPLVLGKSAESDNKGKIVVMDGSFTGTLVKNTTSADASLTIYGGTFSEKPDDAFIAEGFKVVENDDGTFGVSEMTVAAIGTVKYPSLKAALAAAWEMSGDVTIELLDDLAETVVVHQKAGLNLTIDGKGKTLIGEIIIDGNGRLNDADTLTIANINFVANTADDLPLKTTFIDATSTVGYVTGGRYGYAHNVTVANCSFTGDGVSEMVAVRVESGGGGKNITLTGNTGTGLHSLAQLTGVTTATFIDNTISNCGSAVNISGGKGAYLFEGNSFTCTESNGYGIRVKDTTEVEVTIQNGNTFSAVNPLVLGKSAESDNKGKIVVMDGSFTGTLVKNTTSTDASLTIYGGTFSEKPDDAFIAEGFKVVENDDGTFSVKEKEPVAAIGENGYFTLDEAFAAAQAGDVIEILAADTYKLPAKLPNVTVKGTVDGVIFNCQGSGSISEIKNGASFENVSFLMGQSNYHGFYHAGTLNFTGCTFEGKFFSYGDMNFTECTFNQSAADYNMWAYGLNLTYTDCVFNGHGKFINVYNEGSGAYTVSFEGCAFNTDTKNKAAINVKETAGSNVLGSTVIIKDCTLNGEFPANSESATTIVFADGLVMVDDRASGLVTSGGIKVVLDEVTIYETEKALQPDAEGIYHIAGQKDLEKLKTMVNGGNSFEGKTIVLDADIAFEGTWTEGIGAGTAFKGCFDGQDHVISGLQIAVTDGSDAGLFESVYDADIKNITLDEPVISGGKYVGAIAGHGYARISNVSVLSGTVTGVDQVGGVIGYLSCGSVTGSAVDSTAVTATEERAGGIAGKANVDSEYHINGNVVSNVTLSAADSLEGGLVGQIMASESNVWEICDNSLVNITFTNGDNVIGTVREGSLTSDFAGHVLRNRWVPATAYVTMTDGTNSVIIKNYVPVAAIGDNEYYSLADAVAAAQSGDVIQMTADEVIMGNAGVTIPKDLSVTLDLNGYTLSNLVNENKSSQVILNKGSLTVTDSSEAGTGKIMNAVDPNAKAGEWWGEVQYNYATNVITNTGTLTVNGGELYQTAAGSICYAVDNNSTSANAILTVNDGYIHSNGGTAVRQYANSTTYENTVNMNGGTIEAAAAGIWIQLPGSAGQAKKVGLNVTGGTLRGEYAFYDYSYGDIFENTQYVISGGVFDGEVFSYGANLTISDGEFKNTVYVSQDQPSDVSISGGKFWDGVLCYSKNAPENVSENYISGGSFKAYEGFEPEDISMAEDCWLVQDADGWWNVSKTPGPVQIGTVCYLTLADAVAAVPADGTETVITLNDDITGSGIVVKDGQNIVIDFADHTYTVDANVGSTGTVTNGFQLLKGSTVKLENGTLTSTTAKNLIQNYSDLTVENMVLDGTKSADCSYVVSNNCGSFTTEGTNSILANDGKYAFDVCVTNYYPEGVTVTISDGTTVDGGVQYDLWGSIPAENKAKLNITGGTFVNTVWDVDEELADEAKANISVTGGSYDNDSVKAYIPVGYFYDNGTVSLCTEHSFSSVVTEPTCTEGGYTTYTCELCGTVVIGDETEPKGHDCTHESNGDGTHTVKCRNCDYSVVEDCTIEDEIVEPTCLEKGYTIHKCTAEGCTYSYTDTETEALGHEFGEDGKCIRCGAEYLKADPDAPKGTEPLVNADGIHLVWTAVPGAEGYQILRRTSTKKSWTLIGETTDTEYTDIRVTNGTKYYYAIVPYNAEVIGEQMLITEKYLTISTPRITNTATGIKVAWSKNTKAAGYIVSRSTDGGETWTQLKKIKGYKTVSYTDTAVEPGKDYLYSVEPYSGSFLGQIRTAEERRLERCAVSVVSTDVSHDLTWTEVVGADHYLVMYRTSTKAQWKTLAWVQGTDYSWSDCTKSATYYYCVCAVYGTSTAATSKATSTASVKAPVIKLTNVSSGIKISWKKDSKASGYYVYRMENGEYVQIKKITSNKTVSFTDKTVESGKSYTYLVRAYKGSVKSFLVEGTTATFLGASKPTVKAVKGEVQVSWQTVDGAVKYNLYRKVGSKGKWSMLQEGIDGTSFNDTTVKKGKTYYYYVKAVGADGTVGGYISSKAVKAK